MSHVAFRVAPWVAVLCLLMNALVWGVSWWPFRQLEARGLHSLWATTIVYSLAVVLIVGVRPSSLSFLRTVPGLWWLALASGLTNAFFNWSVTMGDVVRVVLLFYLMPVWSVILARIILREPITTGAIVRVVVALLGAMFVLQPAAEPNSTSGLPAPQNLAEWLGVAGGFSFALNNVMLRRYASQPEPARAIAMFLGGALFTGFIAAGLTLMNIISLPVVSNSFFTQHSWALGVLLLTIAFLVSNFALQIGASQLPANVTSIVMLAEVVFASVSAVWLGAATMTVNTWIGGALILTASLLALYSSQPSKE
jgi:drug/metabolite transporter (DMT)-like permease